jgi:peptidoglycan/xylan/chitin deacetylase (PgdA/CDA1 family)
MNRFYHHHFIAKNVEISPKSAYVSFTFDDFPETAFSTGGNLLERYHSSGTFYLAPGLIGQESEVGKIASLDKIQQYFESSHEIGHHSFSHLNCRKATNQNIILDIQEADIFFAKRKVSNFSFPFGETSIQAQKILKSRFDTCRGIEPGINQGTTNFLNLKANAVYSRNNNLNYLISKIKETKLNGGWLIFYSHDICTHPSPYGCTPKELETLIEKSLESGLTICTIRDGASELQASGTSKPA